MVTYYRATAERVNSFLLAWAPHGKGWTPMPQALNRAAVTLNLHVGNHGAIAAR
jgi:hypothetical protein